MEKAKGNVAFEVRRDASYYFRGFGKDKTYIWLLNYCKSNWNPRGATFMIQHCKKMKQALLISDPIFTLNLKTNNV